MRRCWTALLLWVGSCLPAAELSSFGPGIWVVPGQCAVFSGRLLYDQGPDDGLEVLAALRTTKLHESLIELDADDAIRALAALVIVLGEGRGVPPDSLSDLPPRGLPASIWVAWPDAVGHWSAVPAATLIRDRSTNRALAALPAVYSGGAIGTYRRQDHASDLVRRPVLTETGTFCAVFDEENGAPLALAVPSPAVDHRWEANSRILPAPGTRLMVIIAPEERLRTLTPEGLADPHLHDFRVGGPGLRIDVPRERPRAADRDLQRALIAAAQQQGADVAPVFVPQP